MADVVLYNEGATPQDVLQYLRSVHTPDYEGLSNALINPDLSSVSSVALKYWKVVGSSVVEMTPAEKSALDAQAQADLIANAKAAAKSLQDALNDYGRLMRAIVKLTVDEINILRAQHSLADRTYLDAKTAIENLIDGE